MQVRLILTVSIFAPLVTSQEKCIANMSLLCTDVPLFLGFGVETDCQYDPPDDSQPCSPCIFNWDVEVEFTQPFPLAAGGIQLCVSAPFPVCSDAVVAQIGVNPPPYVYKWESVTDNFQVGCGGNLQTILTWTPGFGPITVADMVLTCGSCN